MGLLPDGAVEGGPEQISGRRVRGAPRSGGAAPEVSWSVGRAIRTSSFWLIGMSLMFGILASSTLSFSMVPYLHDDAGISKAQATGVLSLSTFLALAVVGWGYAADRITPRWLLLMALPVATVLTLFLLTVDSLVMAYIFGVVWGVFVGALGVLEQMLLAQYFGRNSYGAITGAMAPMQMVALGLGPTLGAVLADSTGGYTVQFVMVAALYLAAGVMIYLAKPPSPAEAGRR